MKSWLLALTLGMLAALTVCPGRNLRAESDADRDAIVAVLTEQKEAWNRADVADFMKAYWNSPEVTFAGSGGIIRGWQPVMNGYRERYPDAKAMGHLDFTDLEVRPLGRDAALVLGRFHLKRDSDEIGGVFTLVFQRFADGWKIIHDHSSADAKKP